MSKEASIKLNASEISQYSCDDLCQILENAKGNIVLEIPGMGYCQSSLDQAEVYYKALFIGENIASFCENIYCEKIYHYTKPINFVFKPNNIAVLAQQLLWLFPLCDLDLDDDYPADDLYNEYEEFRGNLENRILRFPELGDRSLSGKLCSRTRRFLSLFF